MLYFIYQTSLLDLENVRLPRAKQLYTAGYKTIEHVASCKPEDMCSKVKGLLLASASKIIKSAKVKYLGDVDRDDTFWL